MLIDPRILAVHVDWILIISLVLIFGKIINITIGLLMTGQTLRTSVQVGFGMAQVGEFSFIIATLGQSLNVTSSYLYPIAVAVSVITTFTTPYFIRVSHKFAVFLERKLPVRMKSGLTRYAAWIQERQADTAQRAAFLRRSFRWFSNSIIVVASFVLVRELLLPQLEQLVSIKTVSHLIAWLAAVLVSSPFLWAMFFAFKGFTLVKDKDDSREFKDASILFASRLATVMIVGALSLRFFTTRHTLLVTGGFSGVLLLMFHRQIGASYRWFEQRFLSTFEETPKSKKTTDVLRHLAPWDAHLVRLKVHPNSDAAGKKLSEVDLRNRFGLSVVVIQRGLKTLVAPQPHDFVYPKDELLVLGTDEQVDQARREIEKPPGLSERFKHLSGYELKQYFITERSTLVGKTIKESGIRERFGGMVVGLERGDDRLINPNATLSLKAGDILWIVGETDKLGEFK